MKYKEAKKTLFGRFCTDCLNEILGSGINRKDCYYKSFPEWCPRCQEYHHLVMDVDPLGRLKLVGTRLREDLAEYEGRRDPKLGDEQEESSPEG